MDFRGGETQTLDEILTEVRKLKVPLVEITGGEPLAQKNCALLIEKLIDEKYKVLIETGGSISIESIPRETHIIMDLKCPDSGMVSKNNYDNIELLKPTDEIKFVIASQEDFLWSQKIINEYQLSSKVNLLFSPAWGLIKPALLVEWILSSSIPARLNLQQHKYIWSPKKKGV